VSNMPRLSERIVMLNSDHIAFRGETFLLS
jgi:hypothetical protein